MRTGSDLTAVVLTSSCALVDTTILLLALGCCAARDCRIRYDPSVFQLDDAVTKRRIRFRVRYLNDSSSLLVQPAKQLHDLFGLAGMQIAGGLIRQNQFWIAGNSARHAN